MACYNTQRYHQAVGNVAPDNVHLGRRGRILKARCKRNTKTLARRKIINLGKEAEPLPYFKL